MIQAKDIHIGNLLLNEGRLIEVQGIKPHCGDYMLTLSDGWRYLKNCKPVELTEEWLIRLGFEAHVHIDRRKKKPKKPIVAYQKKPLWADFIDGKPFVSYSISVKLQIESVHQLQNLYFAITGKELTLKP